uniref:Uncharacterized protein n=1 Tax=Sipha flava TaxID=143950 RepID=A0A2S2R9A5_9HEMI
MCCGSCLKFENSRKLIKSHGILYHYNNNNHSNDRNNNKRLSYRVTLFRLCIIFFSVLIYALYFFSTLVRYKHRRYKFFPLYMYIHTWKHFHFVAAHLCLFNFLSYFLNF